MKIRHHFDRMASAVTAWSGSIWATLAAFLLVGLWVLGGLARFGFGSDYQLIINSITTIITYMMVFFIQNAQNREMMAVNLKLDELIRAQGDACDGVMDVEGLPEERLRELAAMYHGLAERSRAASGAGPVRGGPG